MISVDVDCIFSADGRIQVRRIRFNDRWRQVEQGRQWEDEHGRQVLVMQAGHVYQLSLQRENLRWTLLRSGGRPAI